MKPSAVMSPTSWHSYLSKIKIDGEVFVVVKFQKSLLGGWAKQKYNPNNKKISNIINTLLILIYGRQYGL